MAIDLNSIESGITPRPPRILLYGTDGIGKSSWAADSPSPIFTQTEDRLSHIEVDKFPLCNSFEDAMETLTVLYNEKHEYKTHVTDSADWLEMLIQKGICEEYGEETINANSKGSALAYGRGYVLAQDKFRQYLEGLSALRNAKGMMIILIAHADIKRFEDPLRESYDKYWPSLHERIREMLQQWADCILFANYKTIVRNEKSDSGQGSKNKAVGEGERLLYTEERPAFEAKNSYDLSAEIAMPKESPFEPFWEEYKEWIGTKKVSKPSSSDTSKKSTKRSSAKKPEQEEATSP